MVKGGGGPGSIRGQANMSAEEVNGLVVGIVSKK